MLEIGVQSYYFTVLGLENEKMNGRNDYLLTCSEEEKLIVAASYCIENNVK